MRVVLKAVVEQRKIVLITFELFWIVVFLLEAATSSSGAEVAPFVYVNF